MGLSRLSLLSRAAPIVVLAPLAAFAVAAVASEDGTDTSPGTDEFLPFTVQERIPVLEEDGLYPCSECHDGDYVVANPQRRELVDMHDESEVNLVHGDGRFWCLTCHHTDDRDSLTSLEGEKISFDEPHLLCGQCHFRKQRDFTLGTHGKRIDNWQGPRVLAPCTACHDSHDPQIEPREPYMAPSVRSGLTRPPDPRHHRQMPWHKSEAPTADDEGESHE